jgi:hypothetical protein
MKSKSWKLNLRNWKHFSSCPLIYLEGKREKAQNSFWRKKKT